MSGGRGGTLFSFLVLSASSLMGFIFGGVAVIYLSMVVFSEFLANGQLTLGRAVECWFSVQGTYVGVCG